MCNDDYDDDGGSDYDDYDYDDNDNDDDNDWWWYIEIQDPSIRAYLLNISLIIILYQQGQLPGLSIAFPVSMFGILALVAGVLMYWLPETLHAPMHQTIEAAEAAKDDYSIPCCKKPLQSHEVELKQNANDTLSNLL